tara:strand:+ start:993 stop:2387 length:1395 start_codon:yes stop_codon:yes gene_type:complete
MRISSTKAAFTESLTEIMTDVRKPVFVDNAIHYGKYESQNKDIAKVTMITRDYSIATEKTYSIEEEESSLLLSHTKTPGHTYESNVWSTEGINKSTNLLYDSKDTSKKIFQNKVDILDKKIRLNLSNMKNKSLKDLGFDGKNVHMGQPIDVGFRTTDLAIRMSESIDKNLTSFSIGEPLTITNSTTQRLKHSRNFFANNFNNINLITALKLLGKKDNRILDFDVYGNLLFVPFNHHKYGYNLSDSSRIGSRRENPKDDLLNKITVTGHPLAINDEVSVTLNDGERQQGGNSVNIVEGAPIYDPTISSTAEAYTVARNALKSNNLLRGSIESNGHVNAWMVRPGDLVMTPLGKLVVKNAVHDSATLLSDFEFLSTDLGIEDALQSIFEDSITSDEINTNDLVEQIQNLNFSFFDDIEIKSTLFISVNVISTNGLLIGQHHNRVAIGGSAETIGLGSIENFELRSS